ncbi:Transposable element Tc1 transposase, partial [Camponotus floridanus]
GAIFQQDNARPHVARNVQVFFLAQHILLLLWPTRSPDMSPIEHVWDVVTHRLAHYPSPATNELWTWIEVVWHAIPQEHIQHLFDSMLRRLEAFIAAHGGCTKY